MDAASSVALLAGPGVAHCPKAGVTQATAPASVTDKRKSCHSIAAVGKAKMLRRLIVFSLISQVRMHRGQALLALNSPDFGTSR
jgi:hypothetical protein